MGVAIVKKDFYKWVSKLDHSQFSATDKKLINLLVENFDELYELGTAGGTRAKKIGELIEMGNQNFSPILPDLNDDISLDSDKVKKITKLEIGPFRGFKVKENFEFDKNFTFIYGPNGSGKSSFCEGIEYALLGSIEEASSKRIDIKEYIKNIQSNKGETPIIYGKNYENKTEEIKENLNSYRFNFIERNRIENFSRINATIPSVQKNRIAVLFGLENFKNFVDGFTDSFNERYITLENNKENSFKIKSQEIETFKSRVEEINEKLEEEELKIEKLINETLGEEGREAKDLKVFLEGETGIEGIIGDLYKSKDEKIPNKIDSETLNKLNLEKSSLKALIEKLEEEISTLKDSSSQMNFKALYNALKSINENSTEEKTVCPACKTSLERVDTNPFSNAELELGKMEELSKLQTRIKKISKDILNKIKEINSLICELNKIKKILFVEELNLEKFKEFVIDINEVKFSWKENIKSTLEENTKILKEGKEINDSIKHYNENLEQQNINKEKSKEELEKYTEIKSRFDTLKNSIKSLSDEEKIKKNKIVDFYEKNKGTLDEIKKINDKIEINKKYVDSYKKVIKILKSYIENLPSTLAKGLSEKTQEFYNLINNHDSNFEKIENLKLPQTEGEKILIKFKGDMAYHDALQILSEGHIKILGLSLLLSKVVNEKLEIIIFDDIVNAIDDEHRDGVAELLTNNENFKEKQQILTCHGELFIRKLEEKLGKSRANKEVKNYGFLPADLLEERGIEVRLRSSKHYLNLAQKAIEDDQRKDAASRCRQATESISNQLWKKLNKTCNTNLSVNMRSPVSKPDLNSVITGLIKGLKPINGLDSLKTNLTTLKDEYKWNLLNKGAHEDGELPEFERVDVINLIKLLETIEEDVLGFKLEIKSL